MSDMFFYIYKELFGGLFWVPFWGSWGVSGASGRLFGAAEGPEGLSGGF